MGKRDKLRESLHRFMECYELAANPPAIDYARNIEPHDPIESIPTNRQTLLRIGIDTKNILARYLHKIPEKRAQALIDWIRDGSNVAEYQLSDYQRLWLKADRKSLQFILKDKGYQ
jgi:hypothetical protein